ncbi:DUF4199 domain-containing protein [Carboxylicivirga marina]|uniref:DUF4199 domain-containing protein n=1 Tax=Carboxylicivirga marina TaxID=2800988 RepID=UPI002595887F|nr:DUF4199 domain-containing protein [uncultured Carboxylicivirga sp.]
MENKKTSLANHAMTYGLYLGIVSIVLTVALFMTDLFLNQAVGMALILVSIGLLCWVFLDFRKKHNGGYMTFAEGFKLGLLVNIISGVIAAVFKAIYVAFIDPSIVQKTVDFAIEEAYKQQGDMPDEAVEIVEKMYGFIAGPTGSLIIGIVSALIFGAIISLILAAIFKKEQSMFDRSEIMEEAE